MNACAIITGSELLHGQIVDQNGPFLSSRLFPSAIEMKEILVVGDCSEIIRKTIEETIARFDIVFITGGLGPTDDDLTCRIVCDLFGLDMDVDDASKEKMEAVFAMRGLSPGPGDIKMVSVPHGAHVFPNDVGLACGFALKKNGCIVIALPGVPREMVSMFDHQVWPYLVHAIGIEERKHFVMRTSLMRESEVNARVRSLLEGMNVEWGICAKYGICEITFVEKKDRAFPENSIQNAMQAEFGKNLLEGDLIEEDVLMLLERKGLTLACAESCTGGLISKRLTDIPGASKVFMGTVVAYSNEAKMRLLGVSPQTLHAFGAVSEQTAGEMAAGALDALHAHVAISTTGIAGPGGGTEEKPVGTVCFGLAGLGEVKTRKEFIPGDRERIRNFSAVYALNMIRKFLLTI
jgi:nicotinamide-nucleotide amidase